MLGEAGVDVLGEGPRAALCAALSAAERGCAAAGIAAGEALDLLRAARSAAERPGAAAPQVWAATDVPQPDCGPGPADICVAVVRGVTTGRGCTTAGVRTRRSNMIARRPHAPPGRASHDRSSPKFSKFSGSIQEKPATRIVIMQYRSNKTQLPTNENCAGRMPNTRRTDYRRVVQQPPTRKLLVHGPLLTYLELAIGRPPLVGRQGRVDLARRRTGRRSSMRSGGRWVRDAGRRPPTPAHPRPPPSPRVGRGLGRGCRARVAARGRGRGRRVGGGGRVLACVPRRRSERWRRSR